MPFVDFKQHSNTTTRAPITLRKEKLHPSALHQLMHLGLYGLHEKHTAPLVWSFAHACSAKQSVKTHTMPHSKCLSWVTAPFLMAPWIHHRIFWALPVQSCTLQNAKSVLGLRPTTAILQESSTRKQVSSHHRLASHGRQPAVVSNEPRLKLMVESEVDDVEGTTFI